MFFEESDLFYWRKFIHKETSSSAELSYIDVILTQVELNRNSGLTAKCESGTLARLTRIYRKNLRIGRRSGNYVPDPFYGTYWGAVVLVVSLFYNDQLILKSTYHEIFKNKSLEIWLTKKKF